ncbi:MAG: N-acetylmuramoyl-L-alanine amidase [Magnetococcales bacterium]|nr:N-acetylmuramoyl-L-alanine amidase [Magnetococcales bacterium]MBF0439505.1 N-acetylmuramoyl-L-alanine amidase [Magnetococcales bacterium]
MIGLWQFCLVVTLAFVYPTHVEAGVCDCSVAIDVGHAIFAAGATSARGKPEFDFNLTMGALIHDQLVASGFSRSFLIVNPHGLKERVRIAEEKQADLLVSIHHDSVQPYYLRDWEFNGKRRKYSDAFKGYSILVSTKGFQFSKSLEFAKMVGKNFRRAGFVPAYHHSKKVPGGRHNMLDEELGIYQFDNLAVLKNGSMPSVLIEFGVIVNRDEELMLEQPESREKMMRGVVDGIHEFNARNCGSP